MTVYTNKYDDVCNCRGRYQCSICGGELQYPFMQWETTHNASTRPDFLMCGECCERWRDGWMADLIQCAAIVELRRLNRMRGNTLVRKQVAGLEEQGKKQKEAERAAYLREVK